MKYYAYLILSTNLINTVIYCMIMIHNDGSSFTVYDMSDYC